MYKIRAKKGNVVIINDLGIEIRDNKDVYIAKEKFDFSNNAKSVIGLLIIENAKNPDNDNSEDKVKPKQDQQTFVAGDIDVDVPKDIFVANQDLNKMEVNEEDDKEANNNKDVDDDEKIDVGEDLNEDSSEDLNEDLNEDLDEDLNESKSDSTETNDDEDVDVDADTGADDNDSELERLRDQAKELGVERYWLMKEETLKKKINEKLNKEV